MMMRMMMRRRKEEVRHTGYIDAEMQDLRVLGTRIKSKNDLPRT